MLNHHIQYGSEEVVDYLPQPFSIRMVTALLTDSDNLSMYDADQFPHHYEYPASTPDDNKLIKSEPMPQLLTESNDCAWQSKFINHWDSQDCLYWCLHEIQHIRKDQALTEFRIEAMADMDGVKLMRLSRDEFLERFPDFGTVLYDRLQKVKSPFMHNSYCGSDWNNPILQVDEPFLRYSQTQPLTCLDQEPDNCNDTSFGFSSPSDVESGYRSESEGDGQGSAGEGDVPLEPPRPEKRRPGRPRGTRKKNKPEKLGRLWEFIRDLLLNPQYNPSFICWEDYEQGMFRFVHSDRVAKLWGSKKQNGDMNYEKLSRAMRYYYKSEVLLPVYNKRLVYKFGPNATGWRSDHPIFR